MRTLLLIPVLASCTPVGGDALISGAVHLCLAADAEVADGTFDGTTVWGAVGTVVSDGPTPAGLEFEVSDCWNRPARTLAVIDGDGVTWSLGYGLESEGSELTPELAVTAGDDVSLEFVRTVVWGWDHGVVVRDGDGDLLLAGQEGMATDLSSTEGDPLAPLVVSPGEPYGPTVNRECGRVRNVPANFEADETVEVQAGEVIEITVDGSPLQAHNAGSFEYIGQMNCTDTWGPFSYLVWR